MSDQDWLDHRLADQRYLPDEGFTARVVGQLPQKRRPVLSFRAGILGTAGVLAFCLFVLQLLPVMRSFGGFLPAARITISPAQLDSFVQQPAILLGALGCAALLSFIALAVLRRFA